MKRTLVLALGLMLVPAVASAQFEVGLDVFGLTYSDVDGAQDAAIGVGLPLSGMRVGFWGGETLLIETRMEADWDKEGDASATSLMLVPGVNFLVTPQVYVRGEAGLQYFKLDPGTGTSFSGTQYLFGAGVGMRRPLGEGAVLRLEGGLTKGLESLDGAIAFASSTNIHVSAGVSAIIN